MKGSSRGGLDVFDFSKDDELPEESARQFLDKFKSIERISNASNLPRKNTGDIPCVDIDDHDDNPSEETSIMNDSSGIGGGSPTKDSDTTVSFALQFNSMDDGPHTSCRVHNKDLSNSFSELDMRTPSPDASSPVESTSDSGRSESQSNENSVDLSSDAENAIEQASTSDIEEDGSYYVHASSDRMDNMELVGSNGELKIFPEYLMYRGNYYMEPRLSFSQTSVKIEGSASCGEGKYLNLELCIDDIISISCQWINRVEMVLIKLHTDGKCSSSVVEELKVYVVDANWFKKQEAIMTLNEKYPSLWDFVIDSDTGLGEVDVSRRKRYFPDFDEPFEELIYPKGDSDAVSISKRDVDLLQPETFVNDTIIDFYIKYLKNQIPLEDMHRFHFFNSFFFRKLADMDKDPSSASDGREAFLRVRKWTRKINLFEKDYIFIPVNFNLHWSLIVICHPGEVASCPDEDVTVAAKVPCILHMDSIKGSHTGLKNLVQSYLWEEWKEKGNDASEHISSKFSNFRFVSLDLPQQENSFDCGLFLLHYLELFLEEAPPTFNPFKISKFSSYLNADWFVPVEASLKRTLIQKLIHELLDGQSQDAPLDDGCDEPQSPEILETKVENRFNGNALAGMPNPVVAHYSVPESSKGIEIDLLADPSIRNPQDANNEPGLVLRELFEPGSSGVPFLGHCQSFNDQSFYRLDNGVSSMEVEDGGIVAQFEYIPYETREEIDFREMSGSSPQAGGVTNLADGGFGGPNHHAWRSEISLTGEDDHSIKCMDASACIVEDSEEKGELANGNGGGEEVTSPSEQDKHPSLQEKNPNEPELDASAPPADPSKAEIMVVSEDPDNALNWSDAKPENFCSPLNKLQRSPRGSSYRNGSELSLESSLALVRDEETEAPIASIEISEHAKATEQTEEERDAKRRRMTPSTGDCEEVTTVDISEDLHLIGGR